MNSTAHHTDTAHHTVIPRPGRPVGLLPRAGTFVPDACSVADADTVLRVLGTRFAEESGDDMPRHDSTARSDTWTGAFLAGGTRATPRSRPTSPWTVPSRWRASCKAVPWRWTGCGRPSTSAFGVQASGSASGDQEIDLRLRLTHA